MAKNNKTYYEEHKEEIKAYQQMHKEEIKANQKRWYREHKEEIDAKHKLYYQEHRKEIDAKAKQRNKKVYLIYTVSSAFSEKKLVKIFKSKRKAESYCATKDGYLYEEWVTE